jgi:hypothetical protein
MSSANTDHHRAVLDRVSAAAHAAGADLPVGGPEDVTFEQLVAIAGVVGCSPAAFFAGSDIPMDTPGVLGLE